MFLLVIKLGTLHCERPIGGIHTLAILIIIAFK